MTSTGKCYLCGQLGHFARSCPKSPAQNFAKAVHHQELSETEHWNAFLSHWHSEFNGDPALTSSLSQAPRSMPSLGGESERARVLPRSTGREDLRVQHGTEQTQRALSAAWAEDNCELLGCPKSDDIDSVSSQCPVALSSLQSVKTARSKGPKSASISTQTDSFRCSCLVVSARQTLNSNLASSLLPFETSETEQADDSCFNSSSKVYDRLRETIRRLETTKDDGRTADGDGRPTKGSGDDQLVAPSAATKNERRRRQTRHDSQKVSTQRRDGTRKLVVQSLSGITVSSDRDVP